MFSISIAEYLFFCNRSSKHLAMEIVSYSRGWQKNPRNHLDNFDRACIGQ